MRYLSMFSGIEAATVAWEPLGWEAAAFCEIEPFPSAVLKHHYPHVPNLGDVTKANFDDIGPIDLAVFGSPCQSFSVAGKRLGLDDPRGNLALYALGVVERLRPRWFLFENVPGLLSSGDGRDFGAFLGTVGDIGYQCAWRTLDAQHFGVPQRRRRVFVVGYLGDWRRAAAVLFERHSLSGDTPPRREKGQDASERLGFSTVGSLSGGYGSKLGTDESCQGSVIPAIAHSLRAEGFDASEDGTGRGTPLVPVAFAHQQGGNIDLHMSEDMGLTLQKCQTQAVCFTAKDYGADASDISPTLRSGGHDNSHANGGVMPAVAFNYTKSGHEGSSLGVTVDRTDCLRAFDKSPMAVMPPQSAVRRLTPRECERLQGFPDQQKSVTVFVCSSDRQKNAALAEIQSLRSHGSAPLAFGSGSSRNVDPAAPPSSMRLLSQDWPVAVDVQIDFGRQEVRILSRGRLLWSASDVEKSASFPLPMPLGDFVRLSALTMGCLVRGTQGGEAAAAPHSTKPATGNEYVALCVDEIRQLASDAAKLNETARGCMMSTTSPVPPSSPSFASILETWSSCVVAAIAGFIPEQMKSGSSFALNIEARTEYLDITYRGKPAADGPKYKALGNSMAVPVMSWIGQRIAMVEALLSQQEAA